MFEKKVSHVLSSDNHRISFPLWLISLKYQALLVVMWFFSRYVSHSYDNAVVILNSLFVNMSQLVVWNLIAKFNICFSFNFFSDIFCSRAGARHVGLKETLVLFSSRHKVCFSFSPFYKFIGWSKVFASVSICHRCFNTQHATVVKQVNVTRRESLLKWKGFNSLVLLHCTHLQNVASWQGITF